MWSLSTNHGKGKGKFELFLLFGRVIYVMTVNKPWKQKRYKISLFIPDVWRKKVDEGRKGQVWSYPVAPLQSYEETNSNYDTISLFF